jgi:hypothetical protein
MKITRFSYLFPVSNKKYNRMNKLSYLHIWFIARFG